MKIDHIHNDHITEAAKYIEKNGIPLNYQNNIYWVEIKNKKYPFKYIVRIANQLVEGHENEWLEFTSKSEYREYIRSLGFHITSNTNTIPFFTRADIEELSNIAGTTYDLNSIEHQRIVKDLKSNAWEKTKYWFTQVVTDLDGFTGVCKKVWNQRDWKDGNGIITFKAYTWARIFREDDFEKDIYFTLGIDGDSQALVYKLDYQSVGSSRLTFEQKELCKETIKPSPAAWVEISIDDLGNYSWDKLTEETVAFINRYLTLYDKTIEEVWDLNQSRIARLTFNTNGWIMPSGPYGKSSNPDSHEKRHGYGHEEWLFDTGKLIEGYHYGFLEPIRKQQIAYSGKHYNVWLYTIDGESKKRYWVGEIRNVEVLKKEDAEEIKKKYSELGWIKEMEDQIKASGANHIGFSNWKGLDLFNIRFLPSEIILNDPFFELSPDHPLNEQSRYSFTHFKEEFSVKEDYSNAFAFNAPSKENKSDADDSVKTKLHYREPKIIEITYLHKTISERLIKHLRTLYGFENVTPEHHAGYGANRIDIVLKLKDKLIFYEIKTYPTLKSSIREAIGQLMEYSLWTNHKKANELIVITQPHWDFEQAKIYFKHLRGLFNIPLYYQSFDIESNILSEKV